MGQRFFFFCKKFFYYLQNYKNYVELIEKEPFKILETLYEEWHNLPLNYKSYKNYISKNIEIIRENLRLDGNNINNSGNKINIPNNFYDKISSAFKELKKLGIEIDSEEEKEIIENLYVLRNQIETKDFDETNY